MSQRKTPRCLHDAHNLGYRSAIAVGTAPAAIPRPGEAMALRPCLTCGQLTTTTRCPTCTANYELRRQWAPIVAAGGVPCARCGQPITGAWDLDHLPDGTSRPSHPSGNRAAF